MIAIIDYGVGNLFSLSHSLTAVGAENAVTGDPERILRADRVILPGVGAFGDAAKKLRETGLDAVAKAVAARGTPVMGAPGTAARAADSMTQESSAVRVWPRATMAASTGRIAH